MDRKTVHFVDVKVKKLVLPVEKTKLEYLKAKDDGIPPLLADFVSNQVDLEAERITVPITMYKKFNLRENTHPRVDDFYIAYTKEAQEYVDIEKKIIENEKERFKKAVFRAEEDLHELNLKNAELETRINIFNNTSLIVKLLFVLGGYKINATVKPSLNKPRA